MNTPELIARLSNVTTAVPRLGAPWRRMLVWSAISLVAIGPIMAFYLDGGPRKDFDLRFAIEELAIVLTALAAAWAAFSSVIPGRDRRVLLLPLPPLVAWLASLGEGRMHAWLSLGTGAWQLRSDWDCAVATILLSAVPAAVMLAMLRRGAPLLPRTTLLLGALAVAAAVNAGLRVFHAGDFSLVVLVWHFGGAMLISVAIAPLGCLVLNWQNLWTRTAALSQ